MRLTLHLGQKIRGRPSRLSGSEADAWDVVGIASDLRERTAAADSELHGEKKGDREQSAQGRGRENEMRERSQGPECKYTSPHVLLTCVVGASKARSLSLCTATSD